MHVTVASSSVGGGAERLACQMLACLWCMGGC